MWCIYTTKYYLALKRKKILTCATTWMALEDIKLTEIHRDRSRMVVARGRRSCCLMRTEFQSEGSFGDELYNM
jgi:hypothetical protein